MTVRRLNPTAALALAALLAAALAAASEAESGRKALSGVTDLTADPQGARLGLLLPGTQVEVIESKDGWARVRVEGWIKTEEGWGEAAAAAVPAAAAPAATSGASISGAIFVAGRKGKGIVGSGIAVRLVADTPDSRAALAKARAVCRETTDALRAEIDALQQQAEAMLSKPKDATAAFQGYDAAKRARQDKLTQLAEADRSCMNDVDAAAERHTAQRTVTGIDGRFTLDAVPAGSYLVHAWLDAEEMRHEWEVPLVVAPGGPVRLDLTEANRTSSTPLPR